MVKEYRRITPSDYIHVDVCRTSDSGTLSPYPIDRMEADGDIYKCGVYFTR